MNKRHEIKIEVNALNPVEYLACCGIFEIASRFDETALAHWQSGDITTFGLESVISEKELLEIILSTLADWSKWKAIANDAKEVVGLEASFSGTGDQREKFILDWWYESVTPERKFKNSTWKMFAARQNVQQISNTFVSEGEKILKAEGTTSITELLRQTFKSQTKFGFDPRPSVNALDLGYVANDLSGKEKGLPTYLFAEMLSMFGAQFFFPSRTAKAKDAKSTRAWIEESRNELFIYYLWSEGIVISLARVLASNSKVSFAKSIALKSLKSKRGDYLGNLTFSVYR
jgi:hypothetical protein